jgi:GNAT superfamily N-acetyltransferase
VQFVHHVSPRHFLDTARDFLLASEAENNLILGLAAELADQDPLPDPPPFFASIQDRDRVIGCLFRTPPLKVGLTRIPGAAVPLAVRGVADACGEIPGVIGPLETIREFAAVWAASRGVDAAPGMQMGIYAVETVRPPEEPATGTMRVAEAGDAPLLKDWFHRFADEAGLGPPDVDAEVRSLVASGGAFLWEDEGPVCMTVAKSPTPNGIRIGYVYTPPMHRKRGYASALVAGVSQRMIDEGRRFCFLYTDLANPTSNEIYRRIGYQRVATAGDIAFGGTP